MLLKFGQWFLDTHSLNYASFKINSKESAGFLQEGHAIFIVPIIYEEVKDLLIEAQLKHVEMRNTFSLAELCS